MATALTGISSPTTGLGGTAAPATSTIQPIKSTSATGTSANMVVPPLGTALTPTTPTTSPGTATLGTASKVGALTAANAQNTDAATLKNGQYDANDSTNSASQLDSIVSQNSPYIQLAEQQGLLTAAGRGLENSSLAAGASQAAATAAAAPLAQQNASEAATAKNQNAQLGTQASEFNSSQDAAAKELQAQLGTSVSQSNAQAQTANSEFNAQAANAMKSQTSALLEDMNKQNLSGTQAARLASIQSQSAQLIASNQSAASLFSGYLSSMSAMMANKDIAPDRLASSITAMQSMLQKSLDVIDQMNGMSLDLTMPSVTSVAGKLTTTPTKTTTGSTVPVATPKPAVQYPGATTGNPYNPTSIAGQAWAASHPNG